MILKCKNGNVLKLQNAGTVPAFQRAVAAVQNRDTQAVEQARKEAESLKEVEIQRNYNRLHGLPDDYQIQVNPQGTIEQGPKRLYANKLEKYLDETASGQEMVRMADTAKKVAGIGLGVAGGGWLIKGLKATPWLTTGELLGGAAAGKLGQITGKGADDLFHTKNQILDFEKVMPFVGMIGGAKLGRNVLENNTLRGAVESGFQNFKFVPEVISSNAIDYVPIQDFTSTYHYDPRVKLLSRPISEAEMKGIPKNERPMYDPEVLENAKLFAREYGYPEPESPTEIKDMYRRHNTFFRTITEPRFKQELIDQGYNPDVASAFSLMWEEAPTWFKALNRPEQIKVVASRGYPARQRGVMTGDYFQDQNVFVSPTLEKNSMYFIDGQLNNTVKLQRPFSLRDPKKWHIEADWRPVQQSPNESWPKGKTGVGNATPNSEFKVSTKHLIPVDIAKPDDLGTLNGEYLSKRVNDAFYMYPAPKWLSVDHNGNAGIDYTKIIPKYLEN